MDNNIIELNDENFEEEVINSSIPVLVDFYSDWCSPCKKLIPILESLNNDFNGKLKIGKVDIEKTSLSNRYNISSLPSILFFNDRELINRKTGMQSKKVLKEMILEKIIKWN